MELIFGIGIPLDNFNPLHIYYRILVTMATETGLHDFANCSLTELIFGIMIPWDSCNPQHILSLLKPCNHGNQDIYL